MASLPKRSCPFERRYPSALQRDDDHFMALAYNEAIAAWEQDEVPVGAVVVHEDKVVGSAHNSVIATRDPTAHAEMLAITQAARTLGDWRLNACTLYVTKEPCPMCSGAGTMARLGRIVYALPDPKMGGLGGAFSLSAIPTLNHHPAITAGVLEKPCHELLKRFFEEKRG